MGNKKTILVLCNGARVLDLSFFELIAELRGRGYQVHISVPESDDVQPFREIGCQITEITVDRRHKRFLSDYRLYCRYKRLMREVRPDLFLTFTIKPNVLGGLAGKKCGIPGIPFITGLGSSVQKHGLTQSLIFRLCRKAFRQSPVVFTQNYSIAELYRILGIVPVDKIRVTLGAGINLEKFPFVPYPAPEKPLRFLFVGRLMREKGILEYIEAAKSIRQMRPDVIFGVLGGWEEKKVFETVEQAARDKVIEYYGYSYEVCSYLADSHAMVLPSYHEGMSVAVAEAAASGRPVLVSNIPGCCEMVSDGVTGLLFRPRDAESLKSKMLKFLAMPHEERAAMGAAGRLKMEHDFDRHIMVEQYMEEIDRVLA